MSVHERSTAAAQAAWSKRVDLSPSAVRAVCAATDETIEACAEMCEAVSPAGGKSAEVFRRLAREMRAEKGE